MLKHQFEKFWKIDLFLRFGNLICYLRDMFRFAYNFILYLFPADYRFFIFSYVNKTICCHYVWCQIIVLPINPYKTIMCIRQWTTGKVCTGIGIFFHIPQTNKYLSRHMFWEGLNYKKVIFQAWCSFNLQLTNHKCIFLQWHSLYENIHILLWKR